MTLKEYALKLNEAAKKHPNALVIYSKDDEGNDYQQVHFAPTLGHFNDHEWRSANDIRDEEADTGTKLGLKINAVCVN